MKTAKRKSDVFDYIEEDVETEVEEIESGEEELEIPEDDYVPATPVRRKPLKQGRPMVVRQTAPDSYTVVRRRVPLTKSMCKKPGCNYDAAVSLGYKEYKNVPPNRRQEAIDLLNKHTEFVHTANQEHITFESDLETEFLGG